MTSTSSAHLMSFSSLTVTATISTQVLIDGLVSHGVTLYGIRDVCELLGEVLVVEVTNGDATTVADLDILPVDLPQCVMADATGSTKHRVLVNQRFFHLGDGISTPEMGPEALAVPISEPSISLRDAYRMVEILGSPSWLCHSLRRYPADPD